MAMINIYACGGTGLNIASKLANYAGKRQQGFAELNPIFIDTSKSNMTSACNETNSFIFPDMDGSGKKRDTNHKAIAENCKTLIHKFQPGSLNIILHSTSGGSGSVLGPVLAGELVSRDELVMVIAVGSTSSQKETDNTVKTIKSYASICDMKKKVIPAAYFENGRITPRGTVDESVMKLIVGLSVLFSANNRGLDREDLRNWINYDRVTSFKPGFTALDVQTGDLTVGEGIGILSMATLVNEGGDPDINDVMVSYQAVGYVPDVMRETIQLDVPTHFCMTSGFFNQTVARLEDLLGSHHERAGLINQKSVVKADDQVTDDGLVF